MVLLVLFNVLRGVTVPALFHVRGVVLVDVERRDEHVEQKESSEGVQEAKARARAANQVDGHHECDHRVHYQIAEQLELSPLGGQSLETMVGNFLILFEYLIVECGYSNGS